MGSSHCETVIQRCADFTVDGAGANAAWAVAPWLGTPPRPGSVWRGNLYRIDHDDPERPLHWSWSPLPRLSFHLPGHFGRLRFA